MNDKEFAEFLDGWRADFYSEESFGPTYMEHYFSKYGGKHTFTEEQLIDIVAFLSGAEQENVILILGDTKLSPGTYLVLAQASERIKEIKVSYPLTQDDFDYASTHCPKITLSSVLSLDENIVLDLDQKKLVLNSSHSQQYKSTRGKEEKDFDKVKASWALHNAKSQFAALSKKNKDLASLIMITLESSTDANITLDEMIRRIYKEFTGKKSRESTMDQSEFIQFLSRDKEICLADAKRYDEYTKMFKILAEIFDSKYSSDPQSTRTHIDKFILLFSDFVALNQNESHEFDQCSQETIASQELKVLRRVLDDLLRYVVSDKFKIVKSIFNATQLNIKIDQEEQISCSPTLDPNKLLTLLYEIAVKINSTDDKDSTHISIALNDMKDFLGAFEKLATQEFRICDQTLSDYKTLNEYFGPIYKRCLKMLNSLQVLGIDERVLHKSFSIIPEPTKDLSSSISQNKPAIRMNAMDNAPPIFVECLKLILKPQSNSLAEMGLEKWLQDYYIPMTSQSAATHKSKEDRSSPMMHRDVFFKSECSKGEPVKKDQTTQPNL